MGRRDWDPSRFERGWRLQPRLRSRRPFPVLRQARVRFVPSAQRHAGKDGQQPGAALSGGMERRRAHDLGRVQRRAAELQPGGGIRPAWEHVAVQRRLCLEAADHTPDDPESELRRRPRLLQGRHHPQHRNASSGRHRRPSIQEQWFDQLQHQPDVRPADQAIRDPHRHLDSCRRLRISQLHGQRDRGQQRKRSPEAAMSAGGNSGTATPGRSAARWACGRTITSAWT